MNWLILVIVSLAAVVTTKLTAPFFIRFLVKTHWTSRNYLGYTIPATGGVMLLPGLTLAWLGLQVSGRLGLWGGESSFAGSALTLSWGFAFLGLMDDIGGSGEHGGFRRHFNDLLQGELTTGALKAIGGGALALAAALQVGGGFYLIALGTLNIAFGANFINLVDLRPGRALKVYSFLTLLPLLGIGFFPGGEDFYAVALPTLAVAALLAPADFEAKIMLGDSGANLLGSLAGLQIMLAGNHVLAIVSLLLLAGLNLLAEKRSLNELVTASPILSWLDHLGRKR